MATSRFKQVDRSNNYTISWASEGVGGSGKSHFLLTAPDPIYVFLFDPKGIQPLAQQEQFKHKDIRVVEYDFSRIGKFKSDDDKAKFANDLLEQFLEDWEDAKQNARTAGWDKEDHVWEMLRFARLEGVSGKPASYYELNTEYRAWFSDASNAGMNFGVIRGMKERWGSRVNSKGIEQGYATGELEPRGMKEVPELVQVVFRHAWDPNAGEDGAGDFTMTFHEKCRVGNAKEYLGKSFTGLDFQTLGTMLYPETVDTPEVWQ